jgi:hypothetical protein
LDEHEWLACTDPDRMLAFLLSAHSATPEASRQRRASARKFRLLACACCRRIDLLLLDDRSRKALEVSERFADELASARELNEAWENASAAAEVLLGGTAADSYRAGAFGLPSTGRRAMALAARAAAEAAAPLTPEAATRSAFDAAVERGAVPGATAWAVEALGAPARERLLRDLFGNPFRPVVLAPEWRTPTVLAIAGGTYAERAFERLPYLADALEDAGCQSVELLEHCRGPVFHVLGCWALDSIMGKYVTASVHGA